MKTSYGISYEREGDVLSSQKCACYLRTQGGWASQVSKALVQVRRIKMVIDLLKQQGPWCTLALGHLRCLDDRYSIPYFAIQSDDSDKEVDQTSIPKFYKECISAVQELCRKGKVVCTPNAEILWCNSKITFQGKSLKYRHWAKCNLKKVQDVVHNSTLDATYIKNKLENKAGFIFEYQTLKNAVNKSWLNEENHIPFVQNYAPKDVLERKFKTPGGMEKKFSQSFSKGYVHDFNVYQWR